MRLGDVAREFEAVHRTWYFDVDEEQGQLVRVLIEPVERTLAVAGGIDAETGILEEIDGVEKDDRVVIDRRNQDSTERSFMPASATQHAAMPSVSATSDI